MSYRTKTTLALLRLRAAHVSLGTALALALFAAVCVRFYYARSGTIDLSFDGLDSHSPSVNGLGCARPHDAPDGGDCDALKEMRRPSWACLSDMEALIPEFVALYSQRPIDRNDGGMRIDHAFAVWYILRAERPSVVIESGAHRGFSTWLVRNALPTARVISLDPAEPNTRLAGVEYHVGDSFVDFANATWEKWNVSSSDALVFIDDHQSAPRRMFDDNKHGFTRFIVEDNYAYPGGDALSLRILCERDRRTEWPGEVADNFGRNNTFQTWRQHVAQGDYFAEHTAVYYEFPPLAADNLVTRKAADRFSISTPIIDDPQRFRQLFPAVPEWEFEQYRHLAYAQLRPTITL